MTTLGSRENPLVVYAKQAERLGDGLRGLWYCIAPDRVPATLDDPGERPQLFDPTGKQVDWENNEKPSSPIKGTRA